MSIVLSPKWRLLSDTGSERGRVYAFWCPGCKLVHPINTEKPNHCNAKWSVSGPVESLTFSPSINVVGHCHFFIRNGKIDFCGDSKHPLKGTQGVEIPDWPAGEDEDW